MARSYDFAVLRLAPDNIRQESLNIGIIVFADGRHDIRISKGFDKVKAISAAIDSALLMTVIQSMEGIDRALQDQGILELSERLELMSRGSPFTIVYGGNFTIENDLAYEVRLSSILKNLVDPEPALKRQRERRSKLFSQVKLTFKKERVLARKHEDLSSHRILTGYEIDEGLIADLILRNGALHVVETIDASGDVDSLRRTIAEIGVAALVLERTRMKFDKIKTNGIIIYDASSSLERIVRPSLDAAAHQGSKLTNWASDIERTKFILELSSLAVPIENEKRRSAPGLLPLIGSGSNLH